MISVGEAKEKIQKNIPFPTKKAVPLLEAVGCVVAENIRSPLALPVHDNSAMDGFVLRIQDTKKLPALLKIRGDIQAGDTKQRQIRAGEAYRIMTGAFIPRGGDIVLAKEDAVIEDGHLKITTPLTKGKHIRRQGEEAKKGSTVLKKGAVIHPGTVGFLATLGKAKVKVFSKPKVSLIATGSELVKPIKTQSAKGRR